jgi:hypothetical protein
LSSFHLSRLYTLVAVPVLVLSPFHLSRLYTLVAVPVLVTIFNLDPHLLYTTRRGSAPPSPMCSQDR